MEKFLLYLEEADRMLKTADHMVYVTYPLLKDKRLIIKILNEIYLGTLHIINAILQYENYYKRIALYKDAKLNFYIFKDKCASRFGISEQELNSIVEIFNLIEKHKESPMELVKKDKFVILSNNLHTDIVTIEKLKEFILVVMEIFKRTKDIIKDRK